MRTAALVFALGVVVALCGDACHVASGTTVYDWEDVPTIWESAVWFPVLLGGAVLTVAFAGARAGLPWRPRTPADVVLGAAAVLALYALTAVLHGQPETVSVVLCGAIAVAIWAWWDPSPGALLLATVAAVTGPLAEALIVELGAAHYTSGSDSLLGVAAWLPCLYFAAGAVASGIWRPLAGLVSGGASSSFRR